MNIKQHIAILVPGGIGKHHYIPALIDLLNRLSTVYILHLYSFSPTDIHPSLNSNNISAVYPPQIIRWNKLFILIFFLWRIWKDHVHINFSAVHGFWVIAQGFTAVLIGKILKIPNIMTLPGGDIVAIPSIRYGSLENFLNKKIVTWCCSAADCTVLLTRFQQNTMKQNKIVCRQSVIIPYGVNTSKFLFQPHLLATPIRFIFIGNLNKVKDPATLLKTFFLLTQRFDCRLTVVGYDTLDGEMQEYAQSLGIGDNIEWKGKLEHDALVSELHGSDFLLTTSLYEGEGVVVLEAFASGVVVVGTEVGLLSDIDDKNFTVPPGDVEGLAKKIEALLAQPEHLHEMRLKNRMYAEQYSAEWTFLQYKKIYTELIDR
ncbi:MAG: glycosyltransferase [Bacteroidota bacterium]|nr:glycosyltransferase [Bacteroidota bacterium]